MSHLEPSVIKVLREFIRSGLSVRTIADHLEISRVTVRRYGTMLIANEKMPDCACGRPWGHRGWCGQRLKAKGALIPAMIGWKGNKPSGEKV